MPLPAVRCRPEQTIVKMEMAPDLSLRGRFAPVAISGRHWRFAQATAKMVCTDCVCSGAQRAPWAVANMEAFPANVQCLQVCHCEAPKGPWQSREGTGDSHRPPLKWYAPIASVAALSERHGQLQIWRHSRRMCNASKFVIARPQRGRGNLGKAVTFSPGVPCYPPRSCEIAPQGHFLALRAQGATSACGLLAMTNLGASRR